MRDKKNVSFHLCNHMASCLMWFSLKKTIFKLVIFFFPKDSTVFPSERIISCAVQGN